MVSALLILNSLTWPKATLLPIKRMESSMVWVLAASLNEVSSSLRISVSRETISAMSLSVSTPRALMRTTKGTGTGTPGMETTISPLALRAISMRALKPTVVENTLPL